MDGVSQAPKKGAKKEEERKKTLNDNEHVATSSIASKLVPIFDSDATLTYQCGIYSSRLVVKPKPSR